jgi:phosphatidylserine/phosphatidylglycerophosphate/cardiolipin synthase-like enzyme
MNWGMFAAGLAIGFFMFFTFDSFSNPAETVISPEDGSEIISLIDSAKDSIDIEVYVFTSRDVVEALERAGRRGVSIRVIIEKRVIGGENDEIFRELFAKGLDVRFASGTFQLTHSKFIIVDRKFVLIGSHNLSNSALFKNREVSVILSDPKVVSELVKTFETDWELARGG